MLARASLASSTATASTSACRQITRADVVAAAKPGAEIRIDTDSDEIEVGGERFETEPIPPFMAEMVSSGGLIPWAREKLAERGETE